MIKKFFDARLFSDLREMVDFSGQTYGDQIAFKDIQEDHSIREYTFSQLKKDTEAIGAFLLAQGYSGKHFALIGESSYQYVATYLAIVNWVGVIIPIDKELNDTDIIKLLEKGDCDIIFYSDFLVDDIKEIISRCPTVSTAIHIGSADHRHLYPSLEDVIDQGRAQLDSGEWVLPQTGIDPEKMCTILFTSGTTGANKGVMLSHRNLVTNAYASLSFIKLPKVSFSVLPINHSYEFNVHVLCSIAGGMTLCFNDSIKHVKNNLNVFKPNMSLMVPMIVESLHKNIWKEAEKSGLKEHLKYGIWFSNLIRKIGIDQRKTFFFPIIDKLGGNLEMIVSGGAPLNPALIKGMDDIGITVYNGYGITECSPLISTNSPLANRPGSVGQIAPLCEVRVGNANAEGIGEIQAKGPTVMLGYYKDKEATKKTFTEDGWFKTGDLGYLDKKGFLYVTGREKNLIILSNGKNVHPEELEEKLINFIPYLKEVVVFAPKDDAGQDSMIAAEAFLDQDYVDAHGKTEATRQFEEDLHKLNHHLTSYKRIERFSIRDTEFEKTTTKKIKRAAIGAEVDKHAEHHH